MNPPHQLAAELQSRLGRFVRNRVSNPADAEDVLQDVFVKVLSSDGPSEVSKLLPWTYSVARNSIIDFYRARDKQRERTAAVAVEPVGDDDSEEPLSMRGALGDLMAALSEQDQHALRAVDLDGMSQKEYAQELGLDYTTAKSRVQRARKRLRREFDRCCQIIVDSRGAPMECSARSGNTGDVCCD